MSLVVWSEEPRNAETPLGLLCDSEVTPTGLFFVRSHGPVPAIDPGSYSLSLDGLVGGPLRLSLEELRGRFPTVTVDATLACAGNRRSDLAGFVPGPGSIPWGAGAIGNARWTGVRLRDVLLAAEVGPGAGHVAFRGLDECAVEGGSVRFAGSIPLEKALGDEVVLAYEMNGEPLSPEHGFPLRAVVPGYVGARSVKWLSAISVQPEPSTSFFQVRDYTLGGVPLAELSLNSAACAPRDGEAVRGPRVEARGWAIAGGPRAVARVELSPDGGGTWLEAELAGTGMPWTWRFWHAELELPAGDCELLVRAHDSSGASQPEAPPDAANPGGYMSNAWQRVSFAIAS